MNHKYSLYYLLMIICLVALTACTPTAQAGALPDLPTANPADPTPIVMPTPEGDIYLTVQDAGKTIHMLIGQVLVVTLDGNITTGYNWYLASTDNPVIEQVGEPQVQPDSGLPGAAGKISLAFKATSAGKQSVSLVYQRAWEKDTPPQQTFEFTVEVGAAS